MKIDWYQSIQNLGIKGKFDTVEECKKIGMPGDLTADNVLDIGCNSGAYMVEVSERGAYVIHGVEVDFNWRILAQGILYELFGEGGQWGVFEDFEGLVPQYDLVLLLSITHIVEGMTGQEILNKAYQLTKPGGLLIVEINDRLQKEKLVLPKEAVLYGKAKDNRSVYHVVKNNG